MNNFIGEGNRLNYTNSGSAIGAGDVVSLTNAIGVAVGDIAATTGRGALQLEGIVNLACKSADVIAIGNKLFWDVSETELTLTATGNIPAGLAVTAAGSAVLTVHIKLDPVPGLPDTYQDVIADPGDAGAIPITASGHVTLVSTGAETRTLADPSFAGQELELYLDTDGGDVVVTSASAANQTGNNTLTFADAGDILLLVAIEVGGAAKWRIVGNDGIALSTV